MGVVPEKQKQFETITRYAHEFAEAFTDALGGQRDAVNVYVEEGTADDPVALVFVEVPSFATLCEDDKRIFQMAVGKADAVNLYSTEDGWIRITFGILGYYELEDEDVVMETNVLEFKPKTKGEN